MKHLFVTIVFSGAVLTMHAQDFDFVRTVDGKNYWTNVKTEKFDDVTDLSVESGRRVIRIPVSDILLIEYMDKGVKILQPDKLKKVKPVPFDGDLESFIAKGKKVYIPFSYNKSQLRWGGKKMRELLMADNYWEIVGCEDEADFILEYIFDDNGADHAYLLLSDRNGKNILYTSSVGAREFSPIWAGEESAEKLYKKLMKRISGGNFKKSVKEAKGPSDKTHNCLYYMAL